MKAANKQQNQTPTIQIIIKLFALISFYLCGLVAIFAKDHILAGMAALLAVALVVYQGKVCEK